MQACSQRPQHAADLLGVLFKRPLDLHQTTFAMGEAVAHLHLLWYRGRLVRQRARRRGVAVRGDVTAARCAGAG
jgi:hypothetical protein